MAVVAAGDGSGVDSMMRELDAKLSRELDISVVSSSKMESSKESGIGVVCSWMGTWENSLSGGARLRWESSSKVGESLSVSVSPSS